MIDIEIQVFNAVYEHVAPLCVSGGFTSVFVPNPSKFPCASLFEINNITDRRRRSTAESEDFANITFQGEVYAMTKPACREIAAELDEAMCKLGFVRLQMEFIDNRADPRVFRIVGRWLANVDNNHNIFRPSF